MQNTLIRKTDLVVSFNRTFIEKLLKQGYSYPNKFKVIPLGFNTDIFSPRNQLDCRKQLKLDKKAFYFVYCGLSFSFRGLERILNTAKLLKDKAPIHFILVGGSVSEVEALKRTAKLANIDRKITFVTNQTQEQISLYLNAANVLVIPGVLHETVPPLKLFEYMAVKKPILCPDLPAIKEVLGNSGIYFPNHSSEFVKEALFCFGNTNSTQKKANQSYLLSKGYSDIERVRKIIDLMEEISS